MYLMKKKKVTVIFWNDRDDKEKEDIDHDHRKVKNKEEEKKAEEEKYLKKNIVTWIVIETIMEIFLLILVITSL